MNPNTNNSKDNPAGNQSANMYSYHQDDKNTEIAENGAIRRSLGEINPNANPNYQSQNNLYQNEGEINRNSIVIQIDQSPPLNWMFFSILGIIHVIFIIFLANYYNWDDLNYPASRDKDKNKNAKSIIQQKYKLFQDINVMIFLGFGFLRTFLKHYSWSSIAITFIGGILSFEFGLFALICWSSIFRKSWYPGIFDFQHLLDANYCCAATVISIGALLGKLSFAQYFVMIIVETIFSTFNYIILRQSLEIIDIGGALTVHLFGAIFGGVFSLVTFCPKQERERIQISPHLGMNYNSNIFGLFGTLIIISYWPSFNTALVDGNQKYRGIINTYFSIGGSIIATFLMSSIFNFKKLKVEDILNATFSGGIIIAGCCNIIKEFWSCIIFGIISGGLSCFLFFILSEKLRKEGYHDTSGILYYHGIPGFLGGIVSTIFVGNLKNWVDPVLLKENDYKYFIGKLLNYNELNFTLDSSQRAGIQFACIFITILIAGAGGLIAGFSIKFCNCRIAIRYFNDSEFFDVNESESEPFPWEDEQVQLQVHYDSNHNK